MDQQGPVAHQSLSDVPCMKQVKVPHFSALDEMLTRLGGEKQCPVKFLVELGVQTTQGQVKKFSNPERPCTSPDTVCGWRTKHLMMQKQTMHL